VEAHSGVLEQWRLTQESWGLSVLCSVFAIKKGVKPDPHWDFWLDLDPHKVVVVVKLIFPCGTVARV
jgi:hypothetical protein